MLRFLLDEHISPVVAAGLRRRGRRTPFVIGLAEWHAGKFLGAPDETFLDAAATERLTLVTYDRRTIPPILRAWAEEGRRHGGVVFIDEKTISPADSGGIARALQSLWRRAGKWDWSDRVCFLSR